MKSLKLGVFDYDIVKFLEIWSLSEREDSNRNQLVVIDNELRCEWSIIVYLWLISNYHRSKSTPTSTPTLSPILSPNRIYRVMTIFEWCIFESILFVSICGQQMKIGKWSENFLENKITQSGSECLEVYSRILFYFHHKNKNK